jgi:hypothetical protein
MQLTKEQTEKFLSCFVVDARRIINERKKKLKEGKKKPH